VSRAATTSPRGRTGLGLTLTAIVASVSAIAMVGLGLRDRVPQNLSIYGPLIVLGFAAVHVAIRKVARNADPVLFPTAALLSGLGLAMIFRLPARMGGRPGELAFEQATWLGLGLALVVATLIVIRDHRRLDAYTYTLGLGGLVLLLLPIVPGLGKSVNGARLWVELGPLSFQPAELGKVLIVVFLASYLSAKRELLQFGTLKVGPLRLPHPKHLGPLGVAWGASLAVLFLERDMGASLLYFAIFVVMLWVATGRAGYLVLGLVLFAAGAWLGYQAFEHVQTRIDVWLQALDPEKVPLQGYGQLAQGQFAMATGGLVGSGLGRGLPDLIPFVATDFIFAAFGEELGLLGTTGLLLVYLVLIGRGLRAAIEAQDDFGKLLAVGLTAAVGLQAFVIAGGVTRLIPLTGVTLPFVSYGGSSLVSNFIILGLLIRVSAGPWAQRRKATTDG